MPVITLETIIPMFLYGAESPPADLESRLRPDDVPTVTTSPDLEQYMSVVGRFANLFQTKIVKDFFSGNFNLSSFISDSNGVTTVTLKQILESNIVTSDSRPIALNDAAVSVSQYSTGVNDSDWAFRAFVFGSTGFVLSQSTKFINDNGVLRIEGGDMLPRDDGFDLSSSNRLVQLYNDYVLHDLINPYNIAREVLFEFTASDKLEYSEARSSDIYFASDVPSVIATVVEGVYEHADFTLETAIAIIDHIRLRDVAASTTEYIVDGRNVVYGTNSSDELSPNSLTWSLADKSLPITYIAGDGDDIITAGDGNDLLYGGGGNDVLTGGAGNDVLIASGGNDTMSGGAGSDVFWMKSQDGKFVDFESLSFSRFMTEDNPNLASDELLSAEMLVKDADINDAVFWNGHKLSGGTFKIIDIIKGPDADSLVDTFYTGAYTDSIGVIYQVDQSSHSLWAYLPDNSTLVIENWNNGVGGIVLGDKPDYEFYSGYEWDQWERTIIADDNIPMNIYDLEGRSESMAQPGSYTINSAFLESVNVPQSPSTIAPYDFDQGLSFPPDFMSLFYQFQVPDILG